MKKLDGKSKDILDDNVSKIREMFPEVFEEGKIDFEYLRKILGDAVDSNNEKYSFTWNGKSDAIKTALKPTTATLRPDKESSKNWDTTENLFIEGDNLEVLKVLQDSYRNKVKMIYIDPPYNTGHDFVYNDKFNDTVEDYKERTEQAMMSNADSSGRYHTNWLNMMYPRLRLARNLLKDDGAIFISIDDNEVANLRKICDEIFGENNFVNAIAVKMSETSGVKMSHSDNRLPKIKEYVLIYSKNYKKINFNSVKLHKSDEPKKIEKYLKYYSKIIENLNDDPSKWSIIDIKKYIEKNSIEIKDDSELNEFKFKNANRIVYRTNNKAFEGLKFDNPINKVISSTGIEYIWWEGKQMLFLSDYLEEGLCDLWTHISTININKESHGIPTYINGQKPRELIELCASLVLDQDDLALDFFAGSGTTADAILKFNTDNDRKNKFIMVQIPEKIETTSGMNSKTKNTTKQLMSFLDEINRPHFLTEIGKERIKRSNNKFKQPFEECRGFKVFKLDSTNLTQWDSQTEDLGKTLEESINSAKSDRTQEDVLYEVLLKYGINLTTPILEEEINDKKIFSIAGGFLLVCLEKDVDLDTISKIAEKKPERVVFYDHGFKDDMTKLNAEQTLKKAGVEDIRII
ncbi:site-specific DNA-methyltransferase [Candidatus Parcubacteria bacterium]|nr:site-specific DNA-methyltransferase [Candidatus Parcubacteria bacterium]